VGKDHLKHQKRLNDLKGRFKISLKNKIKTYSKGMRQIVGIIQAFMHDPKILILDEPTSGLDPIMQEVFYDLALEERNDGKTIFFSTHILSEVETVCDRVGIIKKGRLIFLEEIEKYRRIVGRNIKIVSEGKNEELIKGLRALIEKDKITVKNDIIEFYFKGDMKKLIDCISKHNIKDFISEIPKIEDLFLDYYKD
jgi:ABC-2 type transport system ATP-binding protein